MSSVLLRLWKTNRKVRQCLHIFQHCPSDEIWDEISRWENLRSQWQEIKGEGSALYLIVTFERPLLKSSELINIDNGKTSVSVTFTSLPRTPTSSTQSQVCCWSSGRMGWPQWSGRPALLPQVEGDISSSLDLDLDSILRIARRFKPISEQPPSLISCHSQKWIFKSFNHTTVLLI